MLEILQKRGNRLVDLVGHHAVTFDDVAVVIPGIRRITTAEVAGEAAEFDEADAFLHESSREQGLTSVAGGKLVGRIDAVHRLGGFGFPAEVADLRDRGLHAVGGLVITDGGFDLRLAGRFGEGLVDLVDETEASTLGRVSFAGLDVGEGQGAIGLDDGSLMLAREIAVIEDAHAAVRDTGVAALQDHEAREVLVLAAEAVVEPGAGAGVSHEREARVEEVVPLGVFADLARHRTDDREVVGAVGDLREEVRHLDARLAVALGFPRGAHDISVVVEDRALDRHRHRFSVQFGQGGLGVEGVDVRDAAGHVAEDDVLGLGLERALAGGFGAEGGSGEQAGQGDATKAQGAAAEQFATGKRVHVI